MRSATARDFKGSGVGPPPTAGAVPLCPVGQILLWGLRPLYPLIHIRLTSLKSMKGHAKQKQTNYPGHNENYLIHTLITLIKPSSLLKFLKSSKIYATLKTRICQKNVS